MTWKDRPHILGFLRQTKGAVAVEFAIVGTLFLVLIAGVRRFRACLLHEAGHYQCQP